MEASLNALERQMADLRAQKTWLINWLTQYEDRMAEIQMQKQWVQEWIHAVEITLEAATNKYTEIYALGEVLRRKMDEGDTLD